MGGSGSTGSSLLKNILGRHPEIFTSQETSIFAKAAIYKDWNRYKMALLGKRWWGLSNKGFHRYDRIDIYPKETHFSLEQVKSLLKKHQSLMAFSHAFFEPACRSKKAQYWLEKTPANAFCFKDFYHAFTESKVIHMVRDPLDTIASLMARGFDPYYATCVYLCNTSAGLSARKLGNDYLEVRYEDLVMAPEKSARSICTFLALTYDANMLVPNQEKHLDGTSLPGWNYHETAKVQQGSVSRFKKAAPSTQAKILHAIDHIRINAKGLRQFDCTFDNVRDIARQLDYTIPESKLNDHYTRHLRSFARQDRKARLRYEFWRPLFHYPINVI